MPEYEKLVFPVGCNAAHHKGIERDQESTEYRQDKKSEEEIHHTSQQETAKGKKAGRKQKNRQDGRHFQWRGHGDASGFSKGGMANNAFIGLANKKAGSATEQRRQKNRQNDLVGIVPIQNKLTKAKEVTVEKTERNRSIKKIIQRLRYFSFVNLNSKSLIFI